MGPPLNQFFSYFTRARTSSGAISSTDADSSQDVANSCRRSPILIFSQHLPGQLLPPPISPTTASHLSLSSVGRLSLALQSRGKKEKEKESSKHPPPNVFGWGVFIGWQRRIYFFGGWLSAQLVRRKWSSKVWWACFRSCSYWPGQIGWSLEII